VGYSFLSFTSTRRVEKVSKVNRRQFLQIATGTAYENPGRIGIPVASDDPGAVAMTEPLVRDIGYEPALVGGPEMGKHLMPGTPLAGERAPGEIRRIAGTLE